jgi:hypothetical protein
MELAMQAKGRRLSGSLQAPGVKDVFGSSPFFFMFAVPMIRLSGMFLVSFL